MQDTARSLIRNVLIFVALLIIAIMLLNFFATLPLPTGSVWIIPAWAPAGAVLLLIVSTYTYWSAGRALLRRREQNFKHVMSMPAAAPQIKQKGQPESVWEMAGQLEQHGIAALGETDAVYVETLDRHPVWIFYAAWDDAILASVMKHPLARQVSVWLTTSFPDGFQLVTVFPRAIAISKPDVIVEARPSLEEAVSYHTARVKDLTGSHGRPLREETDDTFRLAEDTRSRVLPHLVNRVQDRWRKVVSWSTASGVIVAVLMAGAWVSGWFPLIVAALALSTGMIFYLLIQIVFVIQITRMNTPQPESS